MIQRHLQMMHASTPDTLHRYAAPLATSRSSRNCTHTICIKNLADHIAESAHGRLWVSLSSQHMSDLCDSAACTLLVHESMQPRAA